MDDGFGVYLSTMMQSRLLRGTQDKSVAQDTINHLSAALAAAIVAKHGPNNAAAIDAEGMELEGHIVYAAHNLAGRLRGEK